MESRRDPEPLFNVPYFTIDYEHGLITINVTDTNPNIHVKPKEGEIEADGVVKWYHKEPLSSRSSKYWRSHIGNELAHKFLLLDPPGRQTFTLTDFPPGYHFYKHKVGSRANHDDIRTDGYIFGGGYKFRSTHEALCHFAWLMIGKPPGRCKCVYDNLDERFHRHQGNLNKELDAKWSIFRNNRVKKAFLDFLDREAQGRQYEPPQATLNVFNMDFLLDNPIPITTQGPSLQLSNPQFTGPVLATPPHFPITSTSTQYPVSNRFTAVPPTNPPHGYVNANSRLT